MGKLNEVSQHPLFIQQLNFDKFPVIFCWLNYYLGGVGVTPIMDMFLMIHRSVNIPIGGNADGAILFFHLGLRIESSGFWIRIYGSEFWVPCLLS